MKWYFVFALSITTLGLAQDRSDDPGAGFREEDSADARWNETDIGPSLGSVLTLGGPGGTIAKGLSIRVGEETGAAVAYDTRTATLRAAWTGGFLKFDSARFGIVRAPQPDGEFVWRGGNPSWPDARVEFEGTYRHGPHVVLAYRVNGTRVLEAPWAFGRRGHDVVFSRTLHVEPHEKPLSWSHHTAELGDDLRSVVMEPNGAAADVVRTKDSLTVPIPPSQTPQWVTIVVGRPEEIGKHRADLLAIDPAKWTEPGPRLWRETLETQGVRGADDGPYVVDTIAVPFDNPWKALMFLAGLDFLSDGTAVVSTMHGDVWLVKGIDDSLETVTWQRFATGLHQPLGLKVRDDEIFVLGRDQITRLHDHDDDGEADWYECFNNDGATSTGGHDFAACLEADPEGNLYYIRAHEGVCRVSRDGSEHESVAKGFRNPIGLGVSPTGMITAAPQEGTWTPKSAIFDVQPGGWYGFAGPQVTETRPLGYDPPICWMPRLSDNSSGGQTWPTDERFGPLAGRMLHLSYGQCAALLVMHEHVNGLPQGATLRLPMFFESGVMTGRTNPKDGQLYVAGLRGWQTAAAKDGCLQRVRYTGKPVHWPVEWHVRPRGIAMVFASPLDRDSATDPQNWAVEQWNYRYSKEYGSKDYLVSDPRRTGRDEVFVEDVTLSDDGRTVFVEFEDDVEPVMQVGITYLVQAADGTELKETVYGTINAVPE